MKALLLERYSLAFCPEGDVTQYAAVKPIEISVNEGTKLVNSAISHAFHMVWKRIDNFLKQGVLRDMMNYPLVLLLPDLS